ncbi:Ig-like domain-containing protein, partial [Alcanivorax sp. 1008]|uniref:Ig-like domain-containing protein n=1 Tax=Alcanivorax sp. 1008 TaxID=2816853 RepID=UPI001D1D1624|nr:hypothetical protein [Alcanivorax sp. 1008]
MLFLSRYWMIGLFTLLNACGGGSGSGSGNDEGLVSGGNPGGGTETPANMAPEVTFTMPLSGARLNAGDDIHVVTGAVDKDGSIASVILYVDGTVLRELTGPPFEWGAPGGSHDALLRNVAEGNYELVAVAQDNQGAESRAVLSLSVAPPPPPVIKTCDENPSLDRSCTDGSVGTEADDQRALPLAPAIKRDIHLVEVGDGARTDPDSNTRDEGYFTRPHIPPYRTTADGRIAMQTRTRTKDPTAEVFRFFLFEPKRINTSFLSSPPGSATNGAGMDIVANRDSYALPRHRFVASEAAGESESLHSAICNDPGKPMTTCGQGGKNDCHHFSVITPFYNAEDAQLEIWGTDVTVEVSNPKTVDAAIADIRTGEPKRGAVWPGIKVLLETMISGDGHFMVGRVSGAELSYRAEDGRLIEGKYDSVYSAYDPSSPPCDPAAFDAVYPISHIPYDPLIRNHWGVARYPWTYPDGTLIPDGANLSATYPWLTSDGANIFFGTSDGQAPLHGQGKYEVRCLDGITCDL